MRNHSLLAFGVAAALLLGSTSRAAAQVGPNLGPNTGPTYGPGYRGNLSPYLNIQRQNTGINYYLGTRSEQQRRADSSQFRDDIADLDRRDAFAGSDDPRPTPVQSGTPTTFGSTFGYYNNRQNYIAPTVGRGQGGGTPTPNGGRRR